MKKITLIFCCILSACSLSPDTAIQNKMADAYSLHNDDIEQRAEQIGSFLRDLKVEGYIHKKPEALRVDLVYDTYLVHKPLSFKGQKVVVLEEEYFTQWVGCCIAPGGSIYFE